MKDHLGIILEAARARDEPAGHLLLCGPPGLGKTTLAHVVAHEMECRHPTDVRPGARTGRGSRIDPHEPRRTATFSSSTRSTGCRGQVEEVLYPAMEDFQLDLVIGKGPERTHDPARPPTLHPGRRHDSRRADHRASAVAASSSPSGSTITRRADLEADRPALGPDPRRRRSTPTGATRSRAELGGRPGSPTVSCVGSVTSPRSEPTA